MPNKQKTSYFVKSCLIVIGVTMGAIVIGALGNILGLNDDNPTKSKVVDKGPFNDAELCMAGIATDLAWNANPTGGQSPYWRYSGLEYNKHIFKKSGKTPIECHVVGNRIIWKNRGGRDRDTQYGDTILRFGTAGNVLQVNAYWIGSDDIQERQFSKSDIAVQMN